MVLKNLFDFVFSFVGLVVLSPLIIFAWAIAAIETRSNGFYFQKRVGLHGKLFKIIKIKTMKTHIGVNTVVTTLSDPRITKSGGFFRKTKIDELPQLWNILIGQMSFVGPRPDVPGYADKLKGKDKMILSVRPGVTGPAQLIYRNEEQILQNSLNAIEYNNEVLWPDKVRINLNYIENNSLRKDFYYIWKTIFGGNVKY